MSHFDCAGAFVVQLRAATDFGADHRGSSRTHRSGKTAHFESASEPCGPHGCGRTRRRMSQGGKSMEDVMKKRNCRTERMLDRST
jgi:hypothetical protein